MLRVLSILELERAKAMRQRRAARDTDHREGYGRPGTPEPPPAECTVRPQPDSAMSIGPSEVMFTFTEQSTPARFTAIEALEMFVAVTSMVFAFGAGVGGAHVFVRLVYWIVPRLPPVSCPAPG